MISLYGRHTEQINKINKWYEIYEGKQDWEVSGDMDYIPTRKVTNIIRKVIDTRARFMFGIKPEITILPVESSDNREETQEEIRLLEDVVEKVLDSNKFHSKLLKGRKDASIGGRVGIKLWGKNDGVDGEIRLIFMPAQEFFPKYNVEDVDELEEIICTYLIVPEDELEEEKVLKQTWYMEDGTCYLDEGFYDTAGNLLEMTYDKHDTGLDFIPVIVVRNGGLTGDTDGKSDVERLWDNQLSYNKLNSDDIDSLKFQMFGQTVFTDADESTMDNLIIAPGAVIDLQTDKTAVMERRQANVKRLESKFSYSDKFKDTVDRIRGDMFSELDVPDVSLEQLQGVIQSGKSMETLYWGLMAACDEDWTEWGVALEHMVKYILIMAQTYECYGLDGSIDLDKYTVEVKGVYPIKEDEMNLRKLDLMEVNAGVRSKQAYIEKWGEKDAEVELEQMRKERQELDEFFDLEWGD